VVDEGRHGIVDYQNVVILTDKQQNWYLPIWTDKTQAYTIENLIHNTALSDPYYLLCEIIERFSLMVSVAVISDISKSNLFRAQLIFESGGRRFGVECRPSDAIITALIAKAPIFARESVLNTAGIPRGEAHKN